MIRRTLRTLLATALGLLLLQGNLVAAGACEREHADARSGVAAGASTADSPADESHHRHGALARGAAAVAAAPSVPAQTGEPTQDPCEHDTGAVDCSMMAACAAPLAEPAVARTEVYPKAAGAAAERADAVLATRSLAPDVPPPRA